MAEIEQPHGTHWRTRLAPTPSGYLHPGNLVNFALIETWARAHGATLSLRIDDADRTRVREPYLQDIFDAIEFLDIAPLHGPRSIDDMEQWSQEARHGRYWQAVTSLLDSGRAFVCGCSRTQLVDNAECGHHCRTTRARYMAEETSIRASLSPHTSVIIWRRDNVPAYHLASVVDDHDGAMTHVIRGDDLRESTYVQALLGDLLTEAGFSEPSFGDINVAHHRLIRVGGAKLSKSAGLGSVPPLRTTELRMWIAEQVADMAQTLTFQQARNVTP